MSDEVFLESLDDGRISAVVLNRPAKRNALSPALSKALNVLLQRALADASRVMLVRSAVPGAFCAGFDISYIGSDQHEEGEQTMLGCFALIEAARKVTISFADGAVYGGGTELFLSCDLRLATPTASFRITPALLGVVYPYRGLSRFVSVMGITATMELVMTARRIDAEEAMRIGLVTRVVADEAAAMEYCHQAAQLGPAIAAGDEGGPEIGCFQGRSTRGERSGMARYSGARRGGRQQRRPARGHARFHGKARSAIPRSVRERCQESSQRWKS